MTITGITYSIKHGNYYYRVQFDKSIKTWNVSRLVLGAPQSTYKQICNPIQFTGRASSTMTAAKRVLLMGIHAATRGEVPQN